MVLRPVSCLGWRHTFLHPAALPCRTETTSALSSFWATPCTSAPPLMEVRSLRENLWVTGPFSVMISSAAGVVNQRSQWLMLPDPRIPDLSLEAAAVYFQLGRALLFQAQDTSDFLSGERAEAAAPGTLPADDMGKASVTKEETVSGSNQDAGTFSRVKQHGLGLAPNNRLHPWSPAVAWLSGCLRFLHPPCR